MWDQACSHRVVVNFERDDWNAIKIRIYGDTEEVSLLSNSLVVSKPTFNPQADGETLIAYQLTHPTDIVVNLYGPGGPVLSRSFRSGSDGAKAGYNTFSWNGKDKYGEYVGNGIYIAQIATAKGKSLGKMYIVIYSK